MSAEQPQAGAPAVLAGVPVRSRRTIFGIVAVGLFMGSVDSTIVAAALPAIHAGLRTSINWAGWTITIYSLGMVIALPVAGKISDEVGRRRVFFWGVLCFTISSLLCGVSGSIYLLIAFRGTQALGGGALMPASTGLIAEHFDSARDRAIGMFGTINAGGQILGPVLGGLIVGYLSWRWIFFVNVPIGTLLLVGLVKFVPESPRTRRKKTDLRGLALLAAFILSADFCITSIGVPGATAGKPAVLLPGVAALVILGLFIRHTAVADEPFIPVRLLRARGFAVMNTLNLLWGMAGFGVASLLPLYAEDRYHLTALRAATLLATRGGGAILVGSAAVMALRRTGYRAPLLAGLAIVAVGTVTMAIAPRLGLTPYAWLSAGAGLTGLGNGMANPASRNACLEIAPSDVAAITGLRQMFIYLGIILSVSTVTAVLSRTGNPGLAQARILWVVAGVVVLVLIPLTFRVPEHKGTW